MPKRLIAFIIVFISLLSSQSQGEITSIVKKIKQSTVIIFTYDNEGNSLGQGSGFFISKKGYIITNFHVLEGASNAEVKTAKGKLYPITHIVSENRDGDIIKASLDIDMKDVIPLSVSTSLPEVGERVIVIGSPFGLEKTVTDGIVSAVREIPTIGHIIQISAPISPGSSGSPVVNMLGEVIGVVTSQIVEGQNLNFAIPGEIIAQLKPNKKKSLIEWEKDNTAVLWNSAKKLYSEGQTFMWAANYLKALIYFEKAVMKDKNYIEAYVWMGYCYSQIEQYDKSVIAYNNALQIKPGALIYFLLGQTYRNLGQTKNEIIAFENAVQIAPLPGAYLYLGVASYELGLNNEAINYYKEVIRLEPSNDLAYHNIGIIYRELGRHLEAAEVTKESIRINPNNADGYYNLGVDYSNLGYKTESFDAFKEAIRIRPDFAEAHYNIGIYYLFVLGDKSAALNEYKILKDIDTDIANRLFNYIYK